MLVPILTLSQYTTHGSRQKKPRSDECKFRCRPGCSKKFKTSTGRFKHLQLVQKCGKWWGIHSQLIDEKRANDVSSELSSDTGLDDQQVTNTIEMDISEPILYKWAHDNTEVPNMSETVDEDLPSQQYNRLDVFVEEYHGAAQVQYTGPNLYDQLWDSDEYYEHRKLGGPYYPFSGYVEWEVVQWLNSLDVPMEKIDRFFDLNYVSLMKYCVSASSNKTPGQEPAILLHFCPRTQDAN